MESALHQLAVALQREGITHDQAVPAKAAARLCAELGISPKSLRNRRWELRKALEPSCETNQGPVSAQGRRYRSDPAYAASMREKSRVARLRNYASHVFKNTRGNAAKRGLAFELTRKEVADLLAPMRCSMTGLQLRPDWDGSGRNPWWPSLDQIDPCAGYTMENVRSVCWAYNVMKGELTDQEVRIYAHALLRGPLGTDPEAGEKIKAARLYGNGVSASAHLMRTWRASAGDRGLDFSLTYDWLNPRLRRGVCEVTGLSLAMTYEGRAHRNPLVPSADRIDGSEGYSPENVRLVCGWFNYARQDWPDEVVRKVARGLLRQSSRTAFRS